jgi:CheY-like chemotaxis protein
MNAVKSSVLIVDDEPMNLRILMDILSHLPTWLICWVK